MRIVLVNWAHLWDGANKGGGVNGYCQSLALQLVGRGHDVIYLSSGVTYTPGPDGALIGPCEVRRHPDWLGTKIFEVINSPVLAPAIDQFAGPGAETSSPQVEREVARLFGLLKPHVVHFHNIEGLSAACIAEARAAGAAVFYSLHNYHTVCPQAYLMSGYRKPCFDSRAGHACTNCIEASDPAAKRAERARGGLAAVASAPAPPTLNGAATNGTVAHGRPVLHQLMVELKSLISPRRNGVPPAPITIAPPAPPTQDAALAAKAVQDEPSVGGTFAPAMTDNRGQTQSLLVEGIPYIPGKPDHPDWQPLENTPTAEPPCSEAPNAYGLRRAAMVAALNSCDRVLAVSEFVRRKFEALGVHSHVIETMHIGTKAGQIAAKIPDLLFDPPPFDPARPRPIRLVFMGFNNYYKGLDMLADALELMTPEYLERYHLFICAHDGHHTEWRFRRMEPKLGGLTVHHGYRSYDIPWIMGGKDLGITPSVWWDNAPQTVFEYLACGVPVLGANLGGIPDFVRHGENGLLFRGNDRYDLARTLAQIARRPEQLFELRSRVRPPKDIGEHTAELERLYAECLCSAGRARH